MRRAGARAVAVVFALGIVATVADAGHAATGPVHNQVRDLHPRVRGLQVRWRALDGSERVQETTERTTVTFAADVLFEFDKADLTAPARARLMELGEQLARLGTRPVTVAGHTDARGDTAYNQDLSLRRARAVEAALRDRLGGAWAFDVSGYGATRPVAPNRHDDGSDDPDGRARNRRVEVSFPTA